MANPFVAAAAAAAATHDRVMGETFTFQPMARAADVDAPMSVDTGRAVVTGLLAVYGEPSARDASGPVRTPGVNVGHPGHASARPFISLALSRLSYRPRVGDRLTRDATGATYVIAEVLPSTPGFVRLDLNEIRAQ
jgi:hypothetical protein